MQQNRSQPAWNNWSGSVSFTPAAAHTPADEQAVVGLVLDAARRGQTLRVVGSGHSFTPLVATDGVLMSLDNQQGLVSVDRQAGLATVRAGTKIRALGEQLHAHGVAQENLGDIDVQSIAGAVSTGTHGTGSTLGSISTQITGVRLVTGTGEVLECHASRNADVLRVARVGLGALGVMTEVTLRVVPAFRLHYTWRRERLGALLANIERERSANRNFEFYWIPHTDVLLVKRMNLTDRPARGRNLMRQLNDLVLENGAFWLLSEICRMRSALSPRIARLMGELVSSGEDVNYSHLVYATERLVRFNEMEYSLPADQLPEALHEIRRVVERERIDVHFPVECRFVRADDIPLSPAYGRDSAYIAVHMYRGMDYQRYFAAVESICRARGGRPHWGKIHTCRAAELRELYPEWERFQAARRALDPQGVFLNPYLRRLFGEPTDASSARAWDMGAIVRGE